MTEWEKRLEDRLCTVDCVMLKGVIEIIKEEIKQAIQEIDVSEDRNGVDVIFKKRGIK